ncbi:MAG: hypothetical protein JO340_19400 [Acidobacteriaceae bacterium]|nr:hypothetical protein [Acidobacteriaceae bacterium]
MSFPWSSGAAAFPAKYHTPVEPITGFQTANPQPGTPAQPGSGASGLRIVVVQGEKAANVVDKPAIKPSVEVRDKNNAPVAGALVTFATPSDGPGVIFSTGLREASVMTDENGRAAIVSATAVNAGAFSYQIEATYQGQQANATISQTNYMTAAEALGSGATQGAPVKKRSKMIWIVLGGVAVAAGVGAAAFHGGGSSSSAAPAQTVIIGAGSGATVGAPH